MRLEALVGKVEGARTPEEVIIKRQTAPLPQPAVARSDHFQKQVVDLMELVSRAPEPSEAHVMALGEASAAKRTLTGQQFLSALEALRRSRLLSTGDLQQATAGYGGGSAQRDEGCRVLQAAHAALQASGKTRPMDQVREATDAAVAAATSAERARTVAEKVALEAGCRAKAARKEGDRAFREASKEVADALLPNLDGAGHVMESEATFDAINNLFQVPYLRMPRDLLQAVVFEPGWFLPGRLSNQAGGSEEYSDEILDLPTPEWLNIEGETAAAMDLGAQAPDSSPFQRLQRRDAFGRHFKVPGLFPRTDGPGEEPFTGDGRD
ncbi:hypothetical protein AK812_SmicGene6842 [Symbiodinium microadriaticum]|uniref:Uncharacterized protein n=1 Tax=Symbiodinium microadriaticum TaxID=2951 RepID=A0A1Q9EQ47_SYMMI|nr:hypothetical protein AK812_SmicGene6842 [Symbiodinium microadriaticum]